MVGKACQLIPAYFDAEPQFWDRFYSKNMRPIRGYPDYWRFDDTEAFTSGPVILGEQFTNDLYVWRVSIVKDSDLNLTSTYKVTNLQERISYSDQEVNSETVSTYNYSDLQAAATYTHFQVVDTVSLEFDQSGRRMIAFESGGNVFFDWFDSTAPGRIVENYGLGSNPFIVTDNKVDKEADSERLLFYVDGNTQQIVYRKQLDRFSVKYALPSAPSNVVELLKVSKNINGGLTVLYCYDDGSGNLLTGLLTARSDVNDLNVSTDDNIISTREKFVTDGGITFFAPRPDAIKVNPTNTRSTAPSDGNVVEFTLKPTKVFLEEEAIPFNAYTGTVGPTVGDLNSFFLNFGASIDITSNSTGNENRTAAVTSGDLIKFTLG